MDFQSLIKTPVQNWVDGHPVVAWILEHPIWTIGLVVLGIFLFWGLLKAIAHLSERVWLSLLSFPLRFAQWVFQFGFQLFKFSNSQKEEPQQQEPEKQEQLMDLLSRLEAVKKEQDEIMEK